MEENNVTVEPSWLEDGSVDSLSVSLDENTVSTCTTIPKKESTNKNVDVNIFMKRRSNKTTGVEMVCAYSPMRLKVELQY